MFKIFANFWQWFDHFTIFVVIIIKTNMRVSCILRKLNFGIFFVEMDSSTLNRKWNLPLSKQWANLVWASFMIQVTHQQHFSLYGLVCVAWLRSLATLIKVAWHACQGSQALVFGGWHWQLSWPQGAIPLGFHLLQQRLVCHLVLEAPIF